MDRQQIDDFIALSGKYLAIETPHNMANHSGTSHCDSLYKTEIRRDDRFLGVYMMVRCSHASLPEYQIALGGPKRPFWVVSYNPYGGYRGHVARPGGTPTIGKIEGSVYYSWEDNRDSYDDLSIQWQLSVARPLPEELTSYMSVVCWLCKQTGIAVPSSGTVFRPRGIR
jgi:hypothetical protein